MDFYKFKNNVLNFLIRDEFLFRRVNKNMSLRRVVNKKEDRTTILRTLYEEIRHRKRKETYRRVANRY